MSFATPSDVDHTMEPVLPGPPRLPVLPPEVLDIILKQSDDPVFLWATCRQVSSAFRKEVEEIFKGTWLQDTSFMWFRNGAISLWGFEGHFSRIDQEAAFFKIKVHHPWDIFTPIPPGEMLRNLYRFVATHEELSPYIAFFFQHRSVIRIGTDVNNSFFADLPIPNLVIHEDTLEISMDWKSLFSRIFREELVLRELKAKQHINTPHLRPMPTSSPIVVEIQHYEFCLPTHAAFLAHRLRSEVRLFRANSLGWAIHLDDTNFEAVITSSDARMQVAVHAMRLQGLMKQYELEYADCRGMEVAVEKPAENGWSMWRDPGMSENEWYGHWWENEGLEGTTWFEEEEDGESWEVERLARGVGEGDGMGEGGVDSSLDIWGLVLRVHGRGIKMS